MRLQILILLLSLIAGVVLGQGLNAGTWSGTITPMNHPDITTDINYEISYPDGLMNLDIIDHEGQIIITQNVKVSRDTLYFDFNEPEEGVLLRCNLVGNNDEGYFGKCTDREGKYAIFSMKKEE